MTTPTVRAIRQEYPNCIITYATDPTLFRVVENNPDIDTIVDFRTIDPGIYDYFADVTSVCPSYEKTSNPPINRIDLFAKYVGIQLRQYSPIYKPKVDEVEWAQKWLEQKWGERDSYKLIFLSVASVDHRRSWPVDKTTQLINQITAFRPDVRIIIDDFNGRADSWGQPNTTAEKFGFRPAAALINESDLFVGPDSGMLHLAGALGLNIVSIFGPTDPAARINHYPGAIAVTAELGCQYCWYARCSYNHACMNDLPVAKVQEYVLKKLEYKLPEGAFAENKLILHSLGQYPRAEAIKRGLKRGLTEAGYTILENAIAIDKKDIVIDIISTDNIGPKAKLPPKGIINCVYAIVPGPVDKLAALRLAKYYDVIICSTPKEAEYIWDAGVRKPTQIVSLPIFRDQIRLDRKTVSDVTSWRSESETSINNLLGMSGIVVDLDPNTDGTLIAQAAVHGALCIVHSDAKLLIPDSLLVKVDPSDLEETIEWLQNDKVYSNELVKQTIKWCLQNLGKPSISIIATSLYQRMTL